MWRMLRDHPGGCAGGFNEQETAGRSTYQTVPPPAEMPPHVSAMKIAANTTGAMPLPPRASP